MSKSVRPFDPAPMSAQGVSSGWIPADDGTLSHPRIGVRFLRVLMMEGERVLYDQILRAELGGGVFVPVDAAGRVGLQPMWRPQARDQARYRADFPDIDLSGLGRISYEVPRGFGEPSETGEHAAVREAEEETHGRVTRSSTLGPVCDNTAFCPHFTTAVYGRVTVPDGETADPMEGIVGRLAFFTRQGLARLQAEGKLYDGFTLAALALLWIQHPEHFHPAG